MRPPLLPYFAALVFLAMPILALAQTDLDQARNLVRCFEGRHPSLCKKEWLSAAELDKAKDAERRANLQTCLKGRYTSRCRKDNLTIEEKRQVEVAEGEYNAQKCATGRSPSRCNKTLLTTEQAITAQAAESRVAASRQNAYRPMHRSSGQASSRAYGRGYSGGCGSRGGPGWRKANGKCASWRD